MKIVIIGGTRLIGSKLVTLLRGQGHSGRGQGSPGRETSSPTTSST